MAQERKSEEGSGSRVSGRGTVFSDGVKRKGFRTLEGVGGGGQITSLWRGSHINGWLGVILLRGGEGVCRAGSNYQVVRGSECIVWRVLERR